MNSICLEHDENLYNLGGSVLQVMQYLVVYFCELLLSGVNMLRNLLGVKSLLLNSKRQNASQLLLEKTTALYAVAKVTGLVHREGDNTYKCIL